MVHDPPRVTVMGKAVTQDLDGQGLIGRRVMLGADDGAQMGQQALALIQTRKEGFGLVMQHQLSQGIDHGDLVLGRPFE